VPVRDDVAPASRGEQRAYRRALPMTVLERDPAAGRDVRGRGYHDRAQRIEAFDSGGERRAWHVAQIAAAKMFVVFGDVGRIRDDDVEAFVRAHRAPPVTASQVEAPAIERLGTQPLRIAPCDRERVLATVGGDDAQVVSLAGERDGD